MLQPYSELGCAEQPVAWQENDKEQVNLFELSEYGESGFDQVR